MRRGPQRDRGYLAWIRTLPCLCCGSETDIQAAHTGSDGGMAIKASDGTAIPLCADCHTAAAHAYHRLGRAEFARRHQLDLAGEIEALHERYRKFRPS